MTYAADYSEWIGLSLAGKTRPNFQNLCVAYERTKIKKIVFVPGFSHINLDVILRGCRTNLLPLLSA